MQKIILYKIKYHNTPGYTTHTHTHTHTHTLSKHLLRILYKQNNHSHIFFLERAVLEWYFAIFAICNVYKT